MTTESRVNSVDDIEKLVCIVPAEYGIQNGSLDYASAVITEFGEEYFIFASIGAPFWALHSYLGFYGMMTNLIEKPNLVERLLARITTASLETLKAYAQMGIHGVWVEDCYSSADLISVEHFRRFAAPHVKRQIDTINALGMKSIYYFCGDVSDRLEDLVAMQPTCISLEESKKNFVIEIEEIDNIVDARVCLFGNVDAIGILQDGSRKTIAQEVQRQTAVGRDSRRFVMSLGSPVTPSTPTAKVGEFVDMAREAGTHFS